MRIIILLLSVLATLTATGGMASAQQRIPVQPDPRYGTWQRPVLCSHFDVSRAPVCNTNPDAHSMAGDCRTVVFTPDGMPHIRCPEDSPLYYEALRLLDFALTCGENGRMCVDAYVFRPGDRCVYSVVDEYEYANRYDVNIRDLMTWQGLQVYKARTSANRNLETKHRRQERNMRYAADYPYDPGNTGDCD